MQQRGEAAVAGRPRFIGHFLLLKVKFGRNNVVFAARDALLDSYDKLKNRETKIKEEQE